MNTTRETATGTVLTCDYDRALIQPTGTTLCADRLWVPKLSVVSQVIPVGRHGVEDGTVVTYETSWARRPGS